ncbi:LuxR C-terminal-related transcriptional regulator [Streptomyces bacillaris]|uniref:LuxR C-terminal-related transcriptional regulator n=1 Tax=Streptomyces bacillaris TaxID=68179 RepID=UPI0035DCA54D
MPETEVRAALDELSEYALARPCTEDQNQVRPVNPLLGFEALIARKQAKLAAHQQQLEESRAVIAEALAQYDLEYDTGNSVGIRHLEGIEAIREQLELLNSTVVDEFLTLAPGGAQTSANMAASRPLNQRLLERGVQMRTVYLDSIRRDPPTMAHAEWLESLGARVRTAPTLPNRVIIVDRRTALVATHSNNTSVSAVLIQHLGVVTLVCALFESIWGSAEPISAPTAPNHAGLTRQRAEVLRLMAQGNTDESIANSLGISARTVRRIASGLLEHLDARSRFQAGVHAVQRGYLPGASD